MSEIAPSARSTTRWPMAVYAVLGAASLAGAVAALTGSAGLAFGATALGVVVWTFALVRLRRLGQRAAERRHQSALAAWFLAAMAAYVLISQYPQVPAAWPAVLSAVGVVIALYGTVREVVR